MSKVNFKKQMLEESLQRIMYVRNMLESFGNIQSYLTNRGQNNSCNFGSVREELYRRELDEWRGLFMWGLVCDESTKERIKAAAYERFLSDKMDVSNWMFNGENPSSWFVKDEEEFRKNVKELFKPKDL